MHRKSGTLPPVILFCAGVITACADGPTDPHPDRVWQRCEAGIAAGADAECASVAMPLFHDQPDAERIDLAAMRILKDGSTAQLWFLDGGPGDAARATLPVLASILRSAPADYYTFDHRGVGGSQLLDCPIQQSPSSEGGREVVEGEWTACIAYLESSRPDLPALTAFQAAHDLHLMIEEFGEPDKSIIIMGISYGSFLAWQYLHLFGDQAEAVILDGLVPPDWSFAEFDAGLDLTGRSLLDACGDDSACASRLGPDPVATAAGLLARLANGHCGTLGLDAELLKLVSGVLLMIGDPHRRLIPALIHRLDRCAEHDQAAIAHMFEVLFESGGLGEEPTRHSQVLQRHVAMSEMWSAADPTAEELERAQDGYIMTTDVSAPFARTYPIWPRAANRISTDLPSFTGPILLLHGARDPTMPLERLAAISAGFTGASQHVVVVPESGHVTLNDGDCPLSLYMQFIQDASGPMDTGCTAGIPPLVFSVQPEIVEAVFGVPDLWGDGSAVDSETAETAILQFSASPSGRERGLLPGVRD